MSILESWWIKHPEYDDENRRLKITDNFILKPFLELSCNPAEDSTMENCEFEIKSIVTEENKILINLEFKNKLEVS